MKTKEELNVLKEELEALNRKLAELSAEELAQVVGGAQMGSKPLNEDELQNAAGGMGLQENPLHLSEPRQPMQPPCYAGHGSVWTREQPKWDIEYGIVSSGDNES